MRSKIVVILSILAVSLLFLTTTSLAAKKRVRTTTVVNKGVSFSSAKLSRGTNSIVLSLFNLDKASKVGYVLSYSANGIEQGAAGSISPSGATDSRDLYFGTCSHGVCTAHYNIKNATLTVTTYLKSGGTYVKRYRIKI